MQEDSIIFSNRELAFLKALITYDVKFLVVGLAAASLQGAPVVTQDIDLWFQNISDPGIKDALKNVSVAFVPCD